MVINESTGISRHAILNKIHKGLIVSCQALENEPLHGSAIMARMALAAKVGGAAGIRANTREDINEIRKEVDLPIIGIVKKIYTDSDVYITPTLDEVKILADSAADIIAFDATSRKRPGNEKPEIIIKAIKSAGKLAMADVSTYEEGIAAMEMGVDIVSTTMSGYTPYSMLSTEPDFELVQKLSSRTDIPVIAEGRVCSEEQLLKCFRCGAYSVVIGAAITRPQTITRKFVDALSDLKKLRDGSPASKV